MVIQHDPTDILIIGAGASGAAVMWDLSKAGFKVVCLEQGSRIHSDKYPVNYPNWEELALNDWNYNPNIRKNSSDYPINTENTDINPLMFNAVGGSTIHWTAHIPRFHPSDFNVKSIDGIADDWPINYWDLEPYYDKNDEMMGVSGINGDPANPKRSKRQMPPLPLGNEGELIANAFDSLGWHWWPSDANVNSIDYKGRKACNMCGPLGHGCPRQSKASTDITYVPYAIKNGAELRVRARVSKIETNNKGKVTGALYYDKDNNEHFQPANGIVLAMNGIGTPRILLNSSSNNSPNGLSNSSGQVGKNLMFHVYANAQGIFENIKETYKGPLATIIMSQEFYESDKKRGFYRGYTFQMNRGMGGPIHVSKSVDWGKNHHNEFKKKFGKHLGLGICGDDLPEESNYVELDPILKDSNGIPAPKINYKVSKNSRKLLAHGLKNAEIVLKEAGASEIIKSEHDSEAGWHLMGTARMGKDPKNSVVNENCQSHDLENLFIVDGSVFVTGGGVNPTPTIQAIALKTSDYIIKSRTDLKS